MFPSLLVISMMPPRSEKRGGKLTSARLQLQRLTNSTRDIGAKEDDDDTRQSVDGRFLLERHHAHATLVNSSLKIFEYIIFSKLTIYNKLFYIIMILSIIISIKNLKYSF